VRLRAAERLRPKGALSVGRGVVAAAAVDAAEDGVAVAEHARARPSHPAPPR